MLHQGHLGDEIGGGDQFRLGVAPRHHDMQAGPSRPQRSDDGGKIEIIVAQCDIEFIEHDHRQAWISHQFARFAPSPLCGGDIAGAILGLPGKTLAHGVPDKLLAKSLQRVALRRMPGALDELHHADAMATPEHAQSKPEGRRRFSLAGAGMDDEQTFLDRLFGDFGILHGFALGHFGPMPFRFGVIDRLRHDLTLYSIPLMASGKPATTRTTRSARAAMRWLRTPCRSRKRRPSGLSGTMPEPTSLATSTTGAPVSANAASRREISASMSASANIRFDSHSVRQSTSTGMVWRDFSAAARSRGASIVCHCGPRRARCVAMRAAISVSPASAVAR